MQDFFVFIRQSTKMLQMKQVLLILGFVLFISVSCKKDKPPFKTGLYTETIPVPGRSQLNFISSQLVVKGEPGNNYKDTFIYSVSSGKILLTPVWTNLYAGQQFNFEEINESTFRIENLYPGIPEMLKSYMTFKK